jgi:NAD(P)-dependent dehydrogenase (short-subunit alcohol dehydrogenase family)
MMLNNVLPVVTGRMVACPDCMARGMPVGVPTSCECCGCCCISSSQELALTPPLPGCQPGSVEFSQLDLCNLKNVKAFAKRFNSTGKRLDVLICNAGIMSPATRLASDDGLELQFQVQNEKCDCPT